MALQNYAPKLGDLVWWRAVGEGASCLVLIPGEVVALGRNRAKINLHGGGRTVECSLEDIQPRDD